MRLVRFVCVLVAVFAIGISALGQTGTSTIRGDVTDQQGRVVPNATVTLINTTNGGVRTTKTSDTGGFVFDLITPSDYRIEVDAKGFKKDRKSVV